ncbi:PIN domain-containing protein [Agromyces sp. NPDC056379]|uniref:PIN domain-containing protein n=1 Tax=unclassified Agromyces TaxID=2639701 RepID=UPI0035D64522
MKKRLPGYYPILQDQVDAVWENGIVVLDANALLGLYEQTAATRVVYVAALESVQERLWLPHQVALEFHRNRRRVWDGVVADHNEATKKLRSEVRSARKQLDQIQVRDNELDFSEEFDAIETQIKALDAKLKESKGRFNAEKKNGSDPILKTVEELYPDRRVGKPFTTKQRTKHRALGAERLLARQAPGFTDGQKSGDAAFGDYYLWAQIMKRAKKLGADVVLVTDDRKDDWRTSDGGPLPELVSEFAERTGQRILIVDSTAFVERFGANDAAKAAADELRETAATRESAYEALLPSISTLQHAAEVVPDVRQFLSTYESLGLASETIAKMVEAANLVGFTPSWRTTALLGPQSALAAAAVKAAQHPGPQNSLAAAAVEIARAQAELRDARATEPDDLRGED